MSELLRLLLEALLSCCLLMWEAVSSVRANATI